MSTTLDFLEQWLPLMLSCYVVYLLSERIRSPTFRIPGPILAKLTPLYHYYYTFVGTTHDRLKEWHDKYGPVILIAPNSVSINDEEVMREIYGSCEYIKDPSYYKIFSENGPSCFSTSNVAFHKKRRRTIAPAFSQTYLGSMEPLVWQSGVNALMTTFEQSAQSGEVINIYSEFHYMAFDIVGELAFGKSFQLIKNKDHPIVGWLKDAQTRVTLQIMFPILRYLEPPVSIFKKGKDADTRIREFGLNAQRERKKMDISRRDILQLMSDASDPETGEKLTEQDLLSESMTQIFAGTDTTSNTLTWAVYLLAKHPEVTQRLTAELDTAIPDRNAELRDSTLIPLPFLEAVILETFRYLPTVPIGLPRVVPKGGRNLKGFFIPGETVVSVPINCLHLEPSVFPNPDKFQPDRWLVEDTKLMKRHLTPFSYGSRVCLGRNIALMELRLTLAALYRRFDVEAVPNQPIKPLVQLLVLKPSGNAFHVHLKPRK